MADGQNISQRWGDFRPSKTMLLWSCVVCIGLTMLLGFTWGGWVTGETAKEMTESAAEDARAELAAAVCVDRFLKASGVGARLASLKEIDSWNRSSWIGRGAGRERVVQKEVMSGGDADEKKNEEIKQD